MSNADPSTERFAETLRELSGAAEENIDRWQQVKARADHLLAELADDASLLDLVAQEEHPRIVEMISANISTLESVGGAVRRAEAEALRAHGLTLAAIGELFGVSRQRIAELLANGSSGGAAAGR